jgi:CubicO group peptidase (beta-lactamase class C family)
MSLIRFWVRAARHTLMPLVLSATACRGAPATPVQPTAARSARDSAAIDRVVHRIVTRLADVPGVAVAAVRGDRIVYLGGAGFRDREARLAAAPTTPFYLASSTKSFTALLAALLATRGALDLDAPLSRYMPDLRLPPERPADSVTLRQLLTHTMGFSNEAVVARTAYTGEHTPAQLLELLRGSTVTDRAFHYDNLGYVVASLAIDRVTRRPWQRLLDAVLFRPLGMHRTTAFMSEAARWGVAVPYWAGADSVPRRLVQFKRDETMHAAGGVVSTAEDLARWLEANLNEGRVDGRQVIDADAIRESHRMQVRLPEPVTFGPFQRFGYALGWYWGEYERDTLLHHFGEYAGARAHVSFMPRHGIGVAVLLNASGPAADAADLIAISVYDILLAKPGAAARFDSRLAEAERRLTEIKVAVARQRAERAARPSTLAHPLADYLGAYRSAAMGAMWVRAQGGRLRLALGPLDATADFYTRPESVRVEFSPGSGEVVQFFVSARADSLEYDGYVFRRVAGPGSP